MSISPIRSRVCRTRPSISSRLDASATAISIAAFSAASSCCKARRRSLRRAAAITRAPSRANRIAVSRPMPLEAPTTSTTWLVRFTPMLEIVPAPTGKPYPGVHNRFGGHDEHGACPAGQTKDRQRISGKLRRKFMSVPGLRHIPGSPSPKRLSTRGVLMYGHAKNLWADSSVLFDSRTVEVENLQVSRLSWKWRERSAWVEKPLYGGHRIRLRGRPRAGVEQDAADFGFVEGLGEQVVGAGVERFGPEMGIGLGIGDDHFSFPRAFADEMQDIQPLAIGQGGFGENEFVLLLVEAGTRLVQGWHVLQLKGKRMQHLA